MERGARWEFPRDWQGSGGMPEEPRLPRRVGERDGRKTARPRSVGPPHSHRGDFTSLESDLEKGFEIKEIYELQFGERMVFKNSSSRGTQERRHRGKPVTFGRFNVK